MFFFNAIYQRGLCYALKLQNLPATRTALATFRNPLTRIQLKLDNV